MADPWPGHEKFKGYLAIPYLDRDGGPLTIRFRCIKDHDHADPYGRVNDKGLPVGRHGKYMSAFGDVPRMFNVGALHRAEDTIEVCEGEFDALLLESLGLHAVAVPGAELWKPHYAVLLRGYNRVRIWADPDDAGARLSTTISQSVRQAKAVRLRDGDVGDTFKLHGAEGVLELAT